MTITQEKYIEIQKLADEYRKNVPLTTKRGIEYIVDKIYNSPASKYYVEYSTIRRIISNIYNKKFNINENNIKHKMYLEIYNKWLDYIKENNLTNKCQKYKCLDIILNTKASSFFVSKYRILQILYK